MGCHLKTAAGVLVVSKTVSQVTYHQKFLEHLYEYSQQFVTAEGQCF